MAAHRWLDGITRLAGFALLVPCVAVAADPEPVPTVPVDPAAVASEPPKAAPPANRFVQEIVVTAQKREENLQDVPISVTALSGEMLDARGIDDPTQLADVTPGLTYNTIDGFAIVYIRGVGSDAFLTADPSVASYIDGVYYPFSSGLAQTFGRVERVEVLKGPQGTLFGRNSTGGAISITTETPSTTFQGVVDTGYSRFDTWNTNVLLSGPIGQHFAASVAALYNRADSYYDVLDESDLQHLRTDTAKGVRAKLRWMPIDDADVTLGYTRIKQDGMGTALSPNTGPYPATLALGGEGVPRNYSASFDAPVRFTIENKVYTGHARYTLPGLDIKLIGSGQKISNFGETDFDGTNAPIVAFSADPLYSKVQTGELQLLSNKDSWGAGWLEWIGGYYYFHSQSGLKPRLGLFGGGEGTIGIGDLPEIPLGSLIASLPQPLQDVLGPLPLGRGATFRLTGEVETQSHAGFAQATAHATSWLTVTLGARYQKERREATDSTFGAENADGSVTPVFDFVEGAPFPQGSLVKHTSFFSPKVSVSITPLDDVMVYASWQKGNKSGTYNIINIDNGIDYAKPETARAVELGVKSELLDGALRLNAALFQTKIKNLQVQFASLLNGGAVSVENAGGARSRGAELDVLVLPLPTLDPDLVVTAAGAYLDAEYTDYTSGSGFGDITGVFRSNFDFSGERIARTPKWAGTLAVSQTFQVSSGTIEVSADTAYNSGYSFLAQGAPFLQREYQVYNARVAFLYAPWSLRLTLFGNNLSDEVYDLGQFPNDFGRLEVLAPPRSFGVRVNWTL